MIVTTDPVEVARLVEFFEDVVADDPLVFKVDSGRLSAGCGCGFTATVFDACTTHQERLTAALIPEGATR